MKRMKVLISQFFLTVCNPMDCSPPGSSVLRILQVRLLKWVIFSSPGDFPSSGTNLGLLHCKQFIYHLSHQESPTYSKFTIVYYDNNGLYNDIQNHIYPYRHLW